MMGLLMIGSIINYLTRSTLAVAAPTVLKDLDITTQQYSWIASGFQVAIMLQPICGYVMDTIGLKLGFAIFATAWSFICMGHGLAGSWQTLFGLRTLLGFAEGSANPAGMKATSEWFPASERGLAGGFFNMGASLGSMLAAPLVAWAILTHSWQFAFVLTGLIGLVWVGLWLVCYQPPTKHPLLSAAERDYIVAGQETHLAGVGTSGDCDAAAAAELLGHRDSTIPRRSDMGHAVGLVAPVSDDRARVRSEADRAVRVAAVPCRRLGLPVRWPICLTLQKYGGVAPDRRAALRFTVGALHDDGRGVRRHRAEPLRGGGALSLAGFAHQTLSVTVITMASDLFKRNEVATVAGMAGTCGNAGVLIFNLLMGALVARIGYSPFFIGLAVLDILGAIVLWTVVRDPGHGTVQVAR